MKKKCDLWVYSHPTLKKLIMELKIALLLILVGVSNVFATRSYSQVAKVSLDMKSTSLEQVMDKIESQSEFYFIFNQKQIDVNRTVDIQAENKLITDILPELFKGTNVNYVVFDRKILLTTDPLENSSLAIESGTESQQKQITGTVTGKDGTPLPGVNVVLAGTNKGTVTDIAGKYSIEVPQGSKSLTFSFIGMEPQEINIGTLTQINVTLTEAVTGLEEVVVIGYGTQKKANLTGAVSLATAERLENRPIVSAGQGLQGIIPNLNISIRNGDPTTAADFNIRGYQSINGGSPLILVDGVPMALEEINPSDIASVNVLKDASAAAVYGSRAAFGVILVETKKGKTGKVNVTLNTEQSMAKPIFLMDPVTNPYEHVTAWNEANIRTTGQSFWDEDYVAGTKKWAENPTNENAWKVVNGVLRFYGFNDYQKKLITDFAPQQKYDMTISGASENANYYVSFGLLNKDGYLREKNQNFKRYNILMKADFKVNKWLSLDEKIVFNSQVNDQPHNYGIDINSIARGYPILPVQFPDLPYYIEPGDHDQYAQYIGKYFGYTSFFPYLLNGGRETFTNNDLWLTSGVTLTPLKGLKVRSDFSYNCYFRNYQDVASKVEIVSQNLLATSMISNEFSGDDFINNQTDYNQYYVFNAYAEYTLNKFAGHYLKAMVGFNQEWGNNSYIRAQAKSLITPLITNLNATLGAQQTWGGKSDVSLRGIFYRLNYVFKDKYLIEANGRYDGTSRFPKDSRFCFFPSVSVGWRISNESFMAGTKGWLDNLKLRASYGGLGNQLLGSNYYPYISKMGVGSSPYVMSSGFIPYVSAADLVSPSLTWETVTTTNFGLDITILNQRLDISADIYTRDTKNMLMKIVYPAILGTGAPDANAANLSTNGWELSVTWRDKIGQNWQYGLNIALSDNHAKITKYDNPTGSLSEYYVGEKLGEIWGYVTEGIFQTKEEVASAADQSRLGAEWKPGDIRYADLNHDGKIDAGSNTLNDHGDLKVIGNTTPRYSFGINPDVSYKNWTLNIFFQGLFRDYLPDNASWNTFYPFNDEHIEKYYLTETWSEDNRDAYFAAPTIATYTHKNIQPQSRYVQNAAYIRLKNLTLNYNLPKDLISKVGLSRAQVYFSGMNLWEYTKMHKPLDPESVYTVSQEYFMQRIYTLGFKLAF
jgi:TonB-linked SusC/RagA family outer membrane protein